jgi:uncharacterized protein (DUF2147 family)
MKTAILAILVLLAGGPAAAGDVTGFWRTQVDAGVIRIEACGTEICGRTVTSASMAAHPDLTDARNKDPALRGRALKNLLILRVKPLGDGRWGEGWIYNPRDGGQYHATLKLDGPAILKVTGCLVAPLCRTQTWTRAAAG